VIKVKREIGASLFVRDQADAAPATVSKCGCIHKATGFRTREGGTSSLASPDTGL